MTIIDIMKFGPNQRIDDEKDERGDALFEQISNFFVERFQDISKPLVLVCGLSGGPDSMALYHLLRRLAKERLLEVTYVHIDHKWRQESSEEAFLLKKMCASDHTRLVCVQLESALAIGNQEAQGRKERLQIFKRVAQEIDAAGLVLAHHADDCIEGMLKRFFEGLEFSQLDALRSEVTLEGLCVYRPFLKIEKRELKNWLISKKVDFFEDSTNFDPRFWRGFVRSRLIESVKGALGKEIKGPLLRLCDRSKELEEWLDQLLNWQSISMHWGFGGLWSAIPHSNAPILLRHFFRKMSHRWGSHLPMAIADELVKAQINGRSNFSVDFGTTRAIVFQNLIFFCPKNREDHEPQEIKVDHEGNYKIGVWRIRVAQCNKVNIDSFFKMQSSDPEDKNWQRVWRGGFTALLPLNSCLCLPKSGLKMAKRGTTLATYLNKKRIPPPLRRTVPVAIRDNEVVEEWVSDSIRELDQRPFGALRHKTYIMQFEADVFP